VPERPIPPLIPAPADFRYDAEQDAFTFDAFTRLQIGSIAGEETLFAARQLQSTVEDATGLRLPIEKGGREGRGVVLTLSERDPSEPEGYALRVTPDTVRITASTEAGLFYGVQTLRQLVRTQGARLHAMTIDDRPVLAHRGVMLDVSRGKIPTLATLFSLVDGLAAHKYNQLQLYVEHTFQFASHPDIGDGVEPITSDDILALDAYCRARHVELVANLQSFGHQRHMLSMSRYSHLDEVGWRWSLTPAREETYALLDELYADFLPAFTSEWLNVDCDETWDLGTGQSKTLAERLGKGRLYLQHILSLRELAAKHGRRIMVWADVLHHHPELVPELPEDVLLLDWEYAALEHYPTTAALAKAGRTFWVCPGTSTWNSFFPRLDGALANIRQFVRDGLDAGATGMLLTDWGDYGHYQPLSLSWYPYLFGAATAWSGGQTSPEAFDAAFAAEFLGGPSGEAVVVAARRLGRAVAGPSIGSGNGSYIALAFFEDPLGGRLAGQVEADPLAEVLAAAEAAMAAFATLADPVLRQDYGFMARLVAFSATKLMHTRQLQADLAKGNTRLAEHVAVLEADRARVLAFRAEFELCWLRHARRSEIHLTLAHFDALVRSYDTALGWLADQRARVAAGEPVADRGTYQVDPHAFLWEQGFVQLRGRAARAGMDALSPSLREWLASLA
jgi:hypothetical protein